jgi:3-dehydroquinate dehydratase (EC 4.2.1.10)
MTSARTISFDTFQLAAATADLSDEPAAREYADIVEFRLDLAHADASLPDPLTAITAYDQRDSLPLLVTNRPEWEGGKYGGDTTDRLKMLRTAATHDAVVAADIELKTLRTRQGKKAARDIRNNDVSIIASTHNFTSTPPRSVLDRRLHAAAQLGDVGKLAVTAQTHRDALRVLAATEQASRWGDIVATMAMGTPGRHTRVVAPVYGSRIGYAPVNPADATAPGQYDIKTFSKMINNLTYE